TRPAAARGPRRRARGICRTVGRDGARPARDAPAGRGGRRPAGGRAASGGRGCGPRLATARARSDVTAPTLRILIAHDRARVRAGFRMILEAQPDLEVVAEAADGESAIRLAERLHPDVILMDVRMPGLDGLAATRRLAGDAAAAGTASPPRIIVLTT